VAVVVHPHRTTTHQSEKSIGQTIRRSSGYWKENSPREIGAKSGLFQSRRLAVSRIDEGIKLIVISQ
jgi:hypothetical protein